jgi:phage terminase large subunit
VKTQVRVPKAFKELWTPSRYKIYYGGRGSAKSHSFARALLVKGYEKKLRILCAREIQRSISDSVHRLLSDLVISHGLTDIYEIQKSYIKGSNGSLFMFEGLRQNISKVKSLEGIDYCWIEEAEGISEDSWDIIIPTIRKENSEIWMSFNPQRDDDETFKRFLINTPSGAIVREVTYRDNPHFPEVLRLEMEECKQRNEAKYLHIWEGKPITNYDTLVYRWKDTVNEVKERIPYDPRLPLYCSWDFGVSDDTAIIWWQVAQLPKSSVYPEGVEIRIIDEYVANNQPAEHYKKIINSKPYRAIDHYCDPAGANRESDLTSWTMRLGFNFKWDHGWSIAEMVDRANDFMHAVRINREQCPKVWRMFRTWQWRLDRDGRIVLPAKPEHDEQSHPGTAFYYGIINRFPPVRRGGRVLIG